MHSLRSLGYLLVVLLLLGAAPLALAQEPDAITQPTQPTSGPGGSDYPFAAVDRTHVGDQPTGAWIFVPKDVATDQLDELPVVLFIHGFLAVDPETYGGWIDHLVRRGAIVIFPDIQTLNVFRDLPDQYFPNLLAGTRVAIEYLEQAGAPTIRTRPIHVVGHSLGAALAVRYAQDAEALGFPATRTLTIVQPGGWSFVGAADTPVASDVLAQVIVGSADDTVGDADARMIWPLLRDIPAAHRDYVTIVSDDHGQPPLDADHEMVGTSGQLGEEDAMDWFALWRPLDALIACADHGDFCSTALGDTPEHRDMGRWSDGTPVTPLQITDGPPQ